MKCAFAKTKLLHLISHIYKYTNIPLLKNDGICLLPHLYEKQMTSVKCSAAIQKGKIFQTWKTAYRLSPTHKHQKKSNLILWRDSEVQIYHNQWEFDEIKISGSPLKFQILAKIRNLATRLEFWWTVWFQMFWPLYLLIW